MSTYKNKFNLKHRQPKDKSNSLKEIAELSGYKLSGIKTIFEKGKGAYVTRPDSVRKHVTSPEQWGYARVYASLSRGSKSYEIDKSHLVKQGSDKPTQQRKNNRIKELYKPFRSSAKNKVYSVYVKDDKGDPKLIHFGDSRYKQDYSKEARENYLKRSAGIRDKKGRLTMRDKNSANYWARKILWRG